MGKVKWKAFYRNPKGKNPFGVIPRIPTITAELDDKIPQAEVERMARKAGEIRGGLVLIRVEKLSKR